MENNWLKINKSLNFSVCDTTECSVVIDLKAEKQEKVLKMAEAEIEIEKLQAENEKLKEIIKQAIKDFNHEIGTPYYDKLCENAIKLKIRGSIDE